MRIQKASNSTSARPGLEHIPVSLTSECDRLKLEIETISEKLRACIAENERLEVELDEAFDLAEKMKRERKERATVSTVQCTREAVLVRCTDCKEVIEDPLCQSCLNECQRIDNDSAGD